MIIYSSWIVGHIKSSFDTDSLMRFSTDEPIFGECYEELLSWDSVMVREGSSWQQHGSCLGEWPTCMGPGWACVV